MGMFDNYTKDFYVPENIKEKKPHMMAELIETRPMLKVDKGRVLEYLWGSNDRFSWEIDARTKVLVDEDAFVFYTHGQDPSSIVETDIREGRMAYNDKDRTSWTYHNAEWKNNGGIVYPVDGTKEVEFYFPEEDLTTHIVIYNFRYETVYEYFFQGSLINTIDISPETTPELVSGIYHLAIYLEYPEIKFLVEMTPICISKIQELDKVRYFTDGTVEKSIDQIQLDYELDHIKEEIAILSTKVLPDVDSEDNGKFLRVVDAEWQPDTVPSAEDTSF